MASIIVVQNGASKESFERSLEAVQSTGSNEVIVVAPQATLGALKGVIGIDASQPLKSALTAALDKATKSQVVLLDCRLAPANHEFQGIVGSMSQNSSADFICASLRRGMERVSMPDLSIDTIVERLGSNPEWPLLCVGLKKDSLLKLAPLEGDSLTEILAQLIIKGLTNGMQLDCTGYEILSSSPEISSLRMSGDSLGRVLRNITALCNIEDLFPSHPWDNHEEESAAAAYHELAALFVRFGDLDAAGDCLKISDQFEDSPRSLALKAMIARLRGETLGAVANMVASLQSYEMRKHDNNKHYVRFTPGNVEKISDSLQAGLTALNREDNETALQCFSEAVFNFDPFFRETGLEE